MSLLMRPRADLAPPLLDPPTRSRWWYMVLWKYAPKKDYSPEQAALIVAANWHLSSKELPGKAVY